MQKDNLQILIKEQDIKNKIFVLSENIKKDFFDQEIILVSILKGSFIFVADLSRELEDNNVIVDFISCSSYRDGVYSSGTLDIKKDISIDIQNKNVILVEDILDTGNTLYNIKSLLSSRNPKSIKICTLLDKPSRRVQDIMADYVGFVIEDKFVVGYGMDYDEKFRNLKDIMYFS